MLVRVIIIGSSLIISSCVSYYLNKYKYKVPTREASGTKQVDSEFRFVQDFVSPIGETVKVETPKSKPMSPETETVFSSK